MSVVRRAVARLRALIRPDAAERELEREIDAHLQLLADDFVKRGMSRDAAWQARIR